MRRSILPVLLLAAAATATPRTASAQTDRAARFMDNCRDNGGDRERFCEVRNFSMPAAQLLNVDGRENGGIAVHGWNRPNIQVVAMIQAQAESEAEAQAIAKSVNILTNGSEVRSEGPQTGNRQSWSVSYEVYAPRGTSLNLSAQNGGLSVDGIESKMDLRTVNGGLSLVDVDGDIHATTENGGVTAQLSGDRYRGAAFDVRTTNGGVKLALPANYSAQLETGTTNGHLNVDFPVTVQGSLSRHITTQLGGGGAMIRAITTNGGVSVVRR
jgi:hypothetical protein